MKIIIGIFLGLILVSSVFVSNVSAFEFGIKGTSFTVLKDLVGDPIDPDYCSSAYRKIKSYAGQLNGYVIENPSEHLIRKGVINAAFDPNSPLNPTESYLNLKWFLDNVCGGKIPKEAKLNPQAKKMVELAREKGKELGYDFYSNGDYAKKLDSEKDAKKKAKDTKKKPTAKKVS